MRKMVVVATREVMGRRMYVLWPLRSSSLLFMVDVLREGWTFFFSSESVVCVCGGGGGKERSGVEISE